MEAPVDSCCEGEGAMPECETELTVSTMDDDIQTVDVPADVQPDWILLATVPVDQQNVTHSECVSQTKEQAVRPPDRSVLCTFII